MKKILILLALGFAVFFTACSKYDYSSEKAFEDSVKEQAKKEGLSYRDDVEYEMKRYRKDLEEKHSDKIEEFKLEIYKKEFGDRTLKDLFSN